MTKIEWDRREDLRVKLTDLLNAEPLKQALEVCLSIETDSPQTFAGNSDLLHQAALSGCSREGYFRFLRNLRSLTKEPTKLTETPAPWEHTKRVK
jgi:hypothetical protein